MLRFFGIETGPKALDVLLWTLPYLVFLAFGVAGLSFLVQLLFPISLWVHVAAGGLAVGYCFLFLARMRAAAGDETPPEP